MQNPLVEFVSITYGASKGGQKRTINFLNWLLDTNLSLAQKIALHITCVLQTKEQVLGVISHFYKRGITRFVIIRGDGEVLEDGFKYACELVRDVRLQFTDALIYVAGYPQKPSEIASLEQKISYGINGVITQVCFDTKAILDFKKIVKVQTFVGLIYPSEKALKFAEQCGINVPKIEDPKGFLENQVKILKSLSQSHIHFYSLNNIDNLLYLL